MSEALELPATPLNCRRTVVPWILLILALTAVFSHTFFEMWLRWFPAWGNSRLSLYDRLMEGEGYYTHGPIIPIVSLALIGLLVKILRIPLQPAPALGWTVTLGGIGLHLLASLARVNFVSGFAMVVVLAGIVLLLWGKTAFRRLWFPIVFLLFMVPLPEVFIADINFRLKMLAADWGVRLSHLLGVPVHRTGNIVLLPGDKKLVVANVCNGLRTLISLMAFGALYAYVCRLRGLWRLGLFVMTVPIAVISNTVRIANLIVVANLFSTRAASGWYHDLSGVLVYFVAFVLMFSLERLTLFLRKLAGRPATVLPLFSENRRPKDDPPQWPVLAGAMNSRRGYILIAVLGLTALATWWTNRVVPSSMTAHQLEKILPVSVEVQGVEMAGRDILLDEKTLLILENPSYLYRRYLPKNPTSPMPFIDLCLILSKDNRKGVHPPDLCMEGSGNEITAKTDFDIAPRANRPAIPCRELILSHDRNRMYILYTYRFGTKYTQSFSVQQAGVFLNGLLGKNASGALIRISMPAGDNTAEVRNRASQLMTAIVDCLDANIP